MTHDNPEGSPLDQSIAALGEALRNRTLGVVELTRLSIERTERTAHLNAFVGLDTEQSLLAAEGLQHLLDAGHDLGPLHGIPVAMKDNIEIAGRGMAVGSRILADNVASRDATVASRLKRGGAVLVGRTNLHEFAWGGTTDNPHFGRCFNPWDEERIPAGSSGGSGVAVAVGAVPASLGTDTGGSVRLPASMNGVTGIRPTIGRVSTAGVFPLAWSLDTVGPLARSSDDCAVMLQQIGGYDPLDDVTRDVPLGELSRDIDLPLAGMRIGILRDYSLRGLQPGVETAMRATLELLRDAGAYIEELPLPHLDELVDAQIIIDAAEPSAVHQRWLRERPEDYGRDVRLLLEAGLRFSAVDYIQAQRYRAALREAFGDVLRRVDVVLTPTIPFTAPRFDQLNVPVTDGQTDILDGNMVFTALPSLTGTPAMSLPIGVDENGMPVGLQAIAAPFAEHVLFRFGHALQKISDWHRLRPPLRDGATE
jgi:aspartyl-tRNA(Asn)/glutamyl-tRNA(Gln) amidotransferase subunit A